MYFIFKQMYKKDKLQVLFLQIAVGRLVTNGIHGDLVLPAVEGAQENATEIAFCQQTKNTTVKVVMSFVTIQVHT